MSYDFAWRPYVPVAERRRQAEKKLAKLRKGGQSVEPVKIEGRTIASSFWGKSWCSNLERYSDFANRMPRGRTYVRNGSVVDLQIAKLNKIVEKRELKIILTDDARKWLIEKTCADRKYGARPLKRALQKYVEDELSEALIQGDVTEDSTVEVYAADGKLAFREVRAKKAAKELSQKA